MGGINSSDDFFFLREIFLNCDYKRVDDKKLCRYLVEEEASETLTSPPHDDSRREENEHLNIYNEPWTLEKMLEKFPQLNLLIDLTFTKRYYDPYPILKNRSTLKYEKIMTKGHEVPDRSVVQKFFNAVDKCLKYQKDALIGVHCTHGVNRTGYLICRYLIQKMNWAPDEAIQAFNEARGHVLERENYLEDLIAKDWPRPSKTPSRSQSRDPISNDRQPYSERNDYYHHQSSMSNERQPNGGRNDYHHPQSSTSNERQFNRRRNNYRYPQSSNERLPNYRRYNRDDYDQNYRDRRDYDRNDERRNSYNRGYDDNKYRRDVNFYRGQNYSREEYFYYGNDRRDVQYHRVNRGQDYNSSSNKSSYSWSHRNSDRYRNNDYSDYSRTNRRY